MVAGVCGSGKLGGYLKNQVGARILGMFGVGSYSALLWLAAGLSLGVGGQEQPAAQRPAVRPAYPIVHEIQVDGNCRVMPDPAQPAPRGDDKSKSTPRFREDPLVCQIESVHNSEHVEEMIVGNELRRNRINVEEQGYALQNITPNRVVFVVEQPVKKDWRVDSDPQPTEVCETNKGSLAVFRVWAEPGEIVRLHVGVRHTTPMKTKLIRTSN